jgi:hypothetical protein
VRGRETGAPESLEARIADLLARRGLLSRRSGAPPAAGRQTVVSVKTSSGASAPERPSPEPPRGRSRPVDAAARTPVRAPHEDAPQPAPAEPVEFVCEDDVRLAMKRGGKIRIGPDTIITPSARELGEASGVFRRQ